MMLLSMLRTHNTVADDCNINYDVLDEVMLCLLFGAGADLLYGPMRLSHSVRFGG